ncbi:hypothetical protein [Streptomyces sp. Da 82-17]|uniref:hypothetical protein n=1 Tax=Streptomyces sp. Da 82-17 TaxID=3377116 RepID=UPI0038D4D3C2
MNLSFNDESYMLHAAASHVDLVRRDIRVPGARRAIPTLEAVSELQGRLAALIQDRSDDVLYLIETHPDGADRRVAIEAHAAAGADTARAAQHYTAAVAEFGFLHRHEETPDTPELQDAREAAFRGIQEHLESAREELATAKQTLQRAAERIENPKPRSAAATSCSPGATHVKPQAELPTAAAPALRSPASRHAR